MKLEVRNISKIIGKRQIVTDVTLDVSSGEIVALLGTNGAGKTTTFYMILGLIPPDSGRLYLDGMDITTLPIYKRAKLGIGYMSQEYSIFRGLSVRDNLKAVLQYQNLSKKEIDYRCDEALDEMNLHHIADSLGVTLSGGEKRRTEIARCLVLKPKFILFDEPFAGVDPIAVKDAQRIIIQLKDRNIGTLLCDHNVRETLSFCDRGYIMNKSKVIVEGTVEEIVANELAQRYYLGEDFRI